MHVKEQYYFITLNMDNVFYSETIVQLPIPSPGSHSV